MHRAGGSVQVRAVSIPLVFTGDLFVEDGGEVACIEEEDCAGDPADEPHAAEEGQDNPIGVIGDPVFCGQTVGEAYRKLTEPEVKESEERTEGAEHGKDDGFTVQHTV